MKLTFLLSGIIAISALSSTAIAAPNEREVHKNYKHENPKRIEYKRDERRHEKKLRIEHKKEKRQDRKKEKNKQKKQQEKRKQLRFDNHKYNYLTNRYKPRYYKENRYIRHLPRRSTSIWFNGISFSFNDGIYYRKAKKGYHAVMPPRGLRIKKLPRHYSRMEHRNTTYYAYQNVFYIADNGGYKVVDAPIIQRNKAIKIGNVYDYSLGQVYDELPSSAEPVTINSQQYFKYNDIYFLPQINGDEIQYLAISLG